VSRVHADIDALKGLHEALARFRQVMREVAERGDDQIEAARAALEARAGHYRYRLEQCQAELDACRSRAAEASAQDHRVDCSGCAGAVADAAERLERVRGWQRRIDQEASEFRGTADRFAGLLETDVPRTEEQLLAAIASLQAARRVPAGGS
jgi:phage shock protein A